MTRVVIDDYGTATLYRRCARCRSWKPQRIGEFSPRQRDHVRRVVRWDAVCLVCRAVARRERWASMAPQERREIERRRWEAVKADPDQLADKRRRNAEHRRRRNAESRAA